MSTVSPPVQQAALPDRPADPADRHRMWWVAGPIILVGVLLHAGSLGHGFLYDDYMHQYVLRGFSSNSRMRPWNLYDFLDARDLSTGDLGLYAWWMDPTFKARFLRPVTSVSIWLDYKLFGDWAPGYHLTSLLLFAILLVAAFRLFRDLAGPTGAALWALAFLAFEDNLCVPVGWIANRNTLLSALFVVGTMLAVHRYHATARRGLFGLFAVIAFLLAVGAKESGIILFPLTGLYAWFLGSGGEPETISRRIRRVAGSPLVWVFAAITVAYLAFYLHNGYGTRSIMYLTPWGQPLAFILNYLLLVPLGLMSLLFGVSCDLMIGAPYWRTPIAILAVPILVFAGIAVVRVVRYRPLLAFAAGWILVSLLSVAGIEPFDRLLVEASIATALILGLFLHRLGPLRGLWGDRRYALLLLAGLFMLTGILGSMVSIPVKSHIFCDLGRVDANVIEEAAVDMNRPAPRQVVLVNSPSGLGALLFAPTWAVLHDDPGTTVHLLQAGRRAVRWTRQDDRTLVMTTLEEPFGTGMIEVLARAPDAPMTAGRTWRTPLFTVTAVEVEEDGVRTVRLECTRSLDDPSLQFLAFLNGGYEQIRPPAVGQTRDVPTVPKLRPFMF